MTEVIGTITHSKTGATTDSYSTTETDLRKAVFEIVIYFEAYLKLNPTRGFGDWTMIDIKVNGQTVATQG